MKICDFDLNQISNLSYVKRWNIIEVNRNQSVAEHSYNVAMISQMIYEEMNHLAGTPKSPQVEHNMLMWAMIHDLPEMYTGDTPSGFKGDNKPQFVAMENAIFPKYALIKDYTFLVGVLIVKIADYIEAIRYAERHCIDPRKQEVIAGMIEKMDKVISEFDENQSFFPQSIRDTAFSLLC